VQRAAPSQGATINGRGRAALPDRGYEDRVRRHARSSRRRSRARGGRGRPSPLWRDGGTGPCSARSERSGGIVDRSRAVRSALADPTLSRSPSPTAKLVLQLSLTCFAEFPRGHPRISLPMAVHPVHIFWERDWPSRCPEQWPAARSRPRRSEVCHKAPPDPSRVSPREVRPAPVLSPELGPGPRGTRGPEATGTRSARATPRARLAAARPVPGARPHRTIRGPRASPRQAVPDTKYRVLVSMVRRTRGQRRREREPRASASGTSTRPAPHSADLSWAPRGRPRRFGAMTLRKFRTGRRGHSFPSR